ncbi:MAG: cysteine desulfurase [bacterium]|nr:cysteine desulfurase [bacterium]
MPLSVIETQTIAPFDVATVRAQFPLLRRTVYDNRPLVYLDSAATSQKPQCVIDAIVDYYTQHNSNVHRSAHALSTEATVMFEDGRRTVASFLNASRPEEIIFTRGTTEAINLIAQTWGHMHVRTGDVVLLTEMEHHANIVPWQMLCERVGASIRTIPVDERGVLSIDAINEIQNVKVLALTHVSNTLGTINDVKSLCSWARSRGIVTVVDGAQAISHIKADVQDIGCDFYAFSGHKLYGPTGIGVLYGRYALLDAMPPYQGGGSMISTVSFEQTTYNDVPVRFEAGTPNIEGVVALAAAIRWFSSFDLGALAEHEQMLLARTSDGLSTIDGLRVIGTAPHKIGIVSFVVEGVHAADIGALVDRQGVAIRVGHHCNMPLMQCYGLTSTARASFAMYTSEHDVDQLLMATNKAVRMLR